MYEFHYNYILPKYTRIDEDLNGRPITKLDAKLLFTDTDSLCYELYTEDAYADMLEDSDRFDTSDYPVGHKNYSRVNCKVIGKFKDECNSVPVVEFVGLCPKMYSLLTLEGKEKSTAKGIKSSYQKKHMKHSLYKHCLFESVTTKASYHQIGSSNHQLSTNKIVKAALSPFDNKRYLLAHTTDTLAHGHKWIDEAKRSGVNL